MPQDPCPISTYNNPVICNIQSVNVYSFMTALLQEASFHTENKGTRKHPDYEEVRDLSPSNRYSHLILQCAEAHLGDLANKLSGYFASGVDYYFNDVGLPYNGGTFRWGVAGVNPDGFSKISHELENIALKCDKEVALLKLYMICGIAGAAWLVASVSYAAYHKVKYNESVIKNLAIAILFMPLIVLGLILGPVLRCLTPEIFDGITSALDNASNTISSCTGAISTSIKSCGGTVSDLPAKSAAAVKQCFGFWSREATTAAAPVNTYGATTDDATVTLV